MILRNIRLNTRAFILLSRQNATLNTKDVTQFSSSSKHDHQNIQQNRNDFGSLVDKEMSDYDLIEDEELEKDVEKLIESLRKYDDDIAVPVIGSGLVKEHVQKLSIKDMESPDATLSKAPHFRNIVYNEGELDNSDLSKPPSRTNPHPFDLSKPEIAKVLPPTHARSLAAYVNHSKVLQNLLDLGVDLLEIDTKTKLGRHILRMDWDKDVFPKLAWLVKCIGVDSETLGKYLTRNPFFLIQKMDDIKTRVAYLESKKFTKAEICKIVTENRYWLNTDVKTTDARLGWIQRQFRLTGKVVRELIVKESRIIMFGLGPLQRIVLMFNKEFNFSPEDIRKMLLEDPRVFMMDYEHLVKTYYYLALAMNIPNKLIVQYPFALRCLPSDIRKRHELLKKVKRAVYDPELPEYVSLENLLQPSDKKFAEQVAKIKLEVYNKFLKSL